MIKYLLLLSLTAACHQGQAAADTKSNPRKHIGIVQSHKDQIGEICFELQKDQLIRFSIEANQVISFNVHYHLNSKTLYPVEEQEITELKQTVIAQHDETYCLMWTATKDSTLVKYNYSIQ